MAILEDGFVLAFDLNFRVNGSKPGLLLAESVWRRFGRSVIRLRSWKGARTYRDLLRVVCGAMDKGVLVPPSTYDPAAGGHPEAPPRLSGLLLRKTRAEVCERERELTAMGLED